MPVDRIHEPVRLLLRDLRSTQQGLSSREAARRLVTSGRNELRREESRTWVRELARQLTHPLALLLWAAAALAVIAHSAVLSAAIVAVVLVNAGFAFVQERHAERAVEALSSYLPTRATVVRDGRRCSVDAVELVPGDVLVVAEGDALSADARLLEGSIEVDMSTLTGESVPVERWAGAVDTGRPLLHAEDLVFSGTLCVNGQATAVVYRTGMGTEIGRIAALTARVGREESPLERHVRRVAWLIAAVSTVVGISFLPLGWLAGLPLQDAFTFAVGLLVANVPEGLLPTITLALAVGVGQLARRGGLVKRLSAVETLGSTDIICTDKTGTLTQNRMRVVELYDAGLEVDILGGTGSARAGTAEIVDVLTRCSTAQLAQGDGTSDPTEVALLLAAREVGAECDPEAREQARVSVFAFDPHRRLMSTIDAVDDGALRVHTKGAPEEVLARCAAVGTSRNRQPLTTTRAATLHRSIERLADRGLRLIALASRSVPLGEPPPRERNSVERDLTFLGVAALLDPPRPEVADAVARCHGAGIRVHLITGDHGRTAAAVAARVGIGDGHPQIVDADTLDRLSEADLDQLLRRAGELVFARSAPETKLRIADALRAEGHVVAMTGDGVNDAPALRRADIGVAMGRSGTEVARQSATMILTDDNFATIVTAVEAGRRVYDNVRKFILYIFAHTVPEVVPFVIFALSGGAVPLPLTVLLILAIDLGTETLPALALGREPAEPGLMHRPPRPRGESVITGRMLLRAWALMGVVSAGLVMAGFWIVLSRAGWHPGDPVGPGTALHDAYLTATTMTFAGIVACQVGTAVASRTDRASLRQIGFFSNPLLLGGIGFELAFAAAVVYLPPLQALFDTRPLGLLELALLACYPPIVWGVDELARAVYRRRTDSGLNQPG